MNADEHAERRRPGRCFVYACSGACDAGELADRMARRLAREGIAEMSRIAGMGGRVRPLTAKAEHAERMLVIDGRPLACARREIEVAGCSRFLYQNLGELGLRKGRWPGHRSRGHCDRGCRLGTAMQALTRRSGSSNELIRFRTFPVAARRIAM